MKGPKQLPKKITEKLNKRETTKYEKLQEKWVKTGDDMIKTCLLYTSPSPRDRQKSRMPSSA